MKGEAVMEKSKILPLAAAGLGVAAGALSGLYFRRFKSLATIRQLTFYKDYNLYRMDVRHRYSIDNIIKHDIEDDQSFIDAVVRESMPGLPVKIKAPNFGCSAFCMKDMAEHTLMGRNYDFKNNTSALLVHCAPKDGYRSVAFAALDNVSANEADRSIRTKIACLTAPFICLDGMNEKGVSIAVLTLDSEPTRQQTGRPVIATTLLIRLVLDRAATTEEAIQLIRGYDMFATSGRDYHFYITDVSGDSRVVEYDCDSPYRELTVTPVRTVTNFYEMYRKHVKPNQENGIYGHGRERHDAIEEILDENKEALTASVAWKALRAASQEPREDDVTSNTQWSILYNNTDLTAEIAIRRDWDTITKYYLSTNRIG